MKYFFYLILFSFLFADISSAQSPVDTTKNQTPNLLLRSDSNAGKIIIPSAYSIDSFSKRPSKDSAWVMPPGISFLSPQFGWEVVKHHPYFGFAQLPVSPPQSDLRKVHGKELLFYLMIFLLIIFALLRTAFPKYFSDLFRLFFKTTLQQTQVQDQLVQTPLPSLLLNGFFVVSGGLYITFLLEHFNLNPINSFWLLYLYCCLGLTAAYFVKFIGLKIAGWLFSMPEAANSYIFIVFIINKMIGILLLPFLLLLAFAIGGVFSVSLTLSFCLIAILLAYRFILTYSAVRNQIKVNPFHFFLYLCAFEISPLLLVYKGLLLFFGITA